MTIKMINLEPAKEVPVVVRWFGDFWAICHARSYQNAFRNRYNQFKTRGEAVEFAEDNDCVVEKHGHDALQDY